MEFNSGFKGLNTSFLIQLSTYCMAWRLSVHANSHIFLHPDVPFWLGRAGTLCVVCRTRILCFWYPFPIRWNSAIVRLHHVPQVVWNCFTVEDDDTEIFFETSGSNRLSIQRHIPDDLNAQKYRCGHFVSHHSASVILVPAYSTSVSIGYCLLIP